MTISSPEQNIRKHCDHMAKEIARRVMQDLGYSSHARDIGTNVEHHARMVLIDWYLGDCTSGAPHD
jgi:hypothetical protein